MRPRYADLFEALEDPDPYRADAAYDAVLFDRGEALPDLEELYKTRGDNDNLRFLAIQLMGFSEDKRAIPLVVTALQDPSPRVRDEARRESDVDLLRVYEVWMKTGSRRARRLLRQHGVVPISSNRPRRRH